ncbi:PREDICTED: uncharacterized protein LOC109580495 [Amphimedon queenslandica]|uniref:Uncharacterized protein n=1 Tax=Amphimedon queenslandica TaxID=400682 RepID=A0AAN0IXY8_AMPQE|nr:PREDICTED: uncharacterized protein LOC109580495 [Amphimedon queenslandica]|eukprot:XP_019849303.1 PREDICTED: uncharacterized protein LOC109580495 [Amphimedon queenslandica]
MSTLIVVPYCKLKKRLPLIISLSVNIVQLFVSILVFSLGLSATFVTPQYALGSFWAGIFTGALAIGRICLIVLKKFFHDKMQDKMPFINGILCIGSLLGSLIAAMIDGIGAFYLSQINFDRCAHTSSAMQTPCSNNPACTNLTYPSQTCYCCDILENDRVCYVSLLSGRPHFFSGVRSCGSIPSSLYATLVVLVVFHIISGILSVIAIQVFGLLMPGASQINDDNNDTLDTFVATQVIQDEDQGNKAISSPATLSNNNETSSGEESKNAEGVDLPVPLDAPYKKSESQTIKLTAEGEFKSQTQNSKESINETKSFDLSWEALNEEPVKVIKVAPVDKSQLDPSNSAIVHPTHDTIIKSESMEVKTPGMESAHYQTDTTRVESAQEIESKSKSEFKRSNTFDTAHDVSPKPTTRPKGASIDVLPGTSSTIKTNTSPKELTNSKSEERIIIEKKVSQRTHSMI